MLTAVLHDNSHNSISLYSCKGGISWFGTMGRITAAQCQVHNFNPELGFLSVQSFKCSLGICMGIL